MSQQMIWADTEVGQSAGITAEFDLPELMLCFPPFYH